jgi:hypothetical protein
MSNHKISDILSLNTIVGLLNKPTVKKRENQNDLPTNYQHSPNANRIESKHLSADY